MSQLQQIENHIKNGELLQAMAMLTTGMFLGSIPLEEGQKALDRLEKLM